MRVGDNILSESAQSVIDDNWCFINNQLTCNAFINGNYMSNTRYAPYGKYIYVNCNIGVTYTKNIGDFPGYPNPVWYNPKGIANIL